MQEVIVMVSKSLVGLFALILGGCAGSHPVPPPAPERAVATEEHTEFVEARAPGRGHAHHIPPRIQRFDSNHDGVLEANEVPPRLRTWFANVDANHDGVVTAQEVRAWNRQHRHEHGPRPQAQPQHTASIDAHPNELTL